MRQKLGRRAKDQADRKVLRKAGLASMAVVTVVGILLCALLLSRSPFDRSHQVARGTIVDARIVEAGARESNYGGRIVYQLEAQVRYTADGAEQQRWMPVVYPYSYDMMVARLAHRPQECEVFWPSRHPEHPKCRFYDDFK